MCAPPLFSRTCNRNCTLSQTLFNADGLIRLHSRLTLCIRSFMEATGVAYTVSLSGPTEKITRSQIRWKRWQLHCPSPFNPISGPLIVQRRSHTRWIICRRHPGEKCNRLLPTLSVGRHFKLTCFCSARRSHFDLGRSMDQKPFLLKYHTTPWCSDYAKMSVVLQLGVLYPKLLHFVCLQTRLGGKCTHRKNLSLISTQT